MPPTDNVKPEEATQVAAAPVAWDHFKREFLPATIPQILWKSEPIKSLEALLDWSPSCPDEAVHAIVPPLASRTLLDPEDRSRVLVCHDMKGGYLEEDRWICGTANPDAYRFVHWPLVDTFVYFSHEFVTIPPVSWTAAAHRNGVPILGTFITEWGKGAQICDRLLASDELIRDAVAQLVTIARHYRFDGWFINIENSIASDRVGQMIRFCQLLTESVHAALGAESLVIWYDSVTIDGALRWQNTLNERNKAFMLVTDGIFLNYSWSERHIHQASELASVLKRTKDVYVGVDVFGRNCYGGGGFRTHLATDLIRKYKLSVAIFAQGWSYEVHGPKDFVKNDERLWAAMSLPVAHVPNRLPFRTSFCQGAGTSYTHEGTTVTESGPGNGKWTNLYQQDIQSHAVVVVGGGKSSSGRSVPIEMCRDRAYSGGSCLRVRLNAEHPENEILKCDFKSGPSSSWTIELIYELEKPKDLSNHQDQAAVCLSYKTKDNSGLTCSRREFVKTKNNSWSLLREVVKCENQKIDSLVSISVKLNPENEIDADEGGVTLLIGQLSCT